MEKLFTNNNEYLDFANALAYRRIKKLERSNSAYNTEVEEALTECGEIFEKYGSETNYIADIIDLELKVQNGEAQKINSVELEDLSLRRESLYNKYNSFLEKLPLDVKEDLEFYFKKIFDRKLRYSHALDLVNQIKREYPASDNLTVVEIMEQPIFQSISSYLNKDEKVEVKEETPIVEKQEETNNLPYVVQIKKAPEELLKEEVKDEPVLEEPKEKEINSNIFEENNIDDIIPSFNELPEQKIDTIEPKEEMEMPKENVEAEDIFTPFEDLPLIEEPTNELDFQEEIPVEINEEAQKEIDEVLPEVKEEEEKLTYTMEKGDTLTGLACAICEDENGWYDIFEANKEALEARLKEAGLSKNDPFENNEEVFAGLTLTIPNVYEKGSQTKGLAA